MNSTGYAESNKSQAQDGTSRSNEILDSFNDYVGLVAVQQNNGDANAIGSATGVAVTLGIAQSIEQNVNADGTVGNGTTFAWGEGERSNMIDPSFQNAQGMFSVQQNNGNGNALNIATAVSYNDGGNEGVDQTVTSTGEVINVWAFDKDQTRDNTLTDQSFENMQGVATVQQNNGDNNVMSAAVGLAVNDGHGALTPSSQTIAATGTVTNAFAKEPGQATRDNMLDGAAFDNAIGVLSVQQNNGSNNVIGSATGLVANIYDGDSSHSNANGFSSVEALVEDSTVIESNGERTNTLGDAFNGAQGVMTVQQNNGNNNVVQATNRIIGTDVEIDPFGPASSMTELNTTVTGNLASVGGEDDLSQYVNNTSGVANGVGGVFVIQQNNGNNTGMGSAISMVVNGPAISFVK